MDDARNESPALERVRRAWLADPGSTESTRELAGEWTRRGRWSEARRVLAKAAVAGCVGTGAIASALRLTTWGGTVGGWPHRHWSGLAPLETAPSEAWTFESPWSDDRFGLPIGVVANRMLLVAQSVVVGMRFVRLVALDLESGSLAWAREFRRVFAPSGPVPIGDEPSFAWTHAAETPDGFDLVCVTVSAEDGVERSESRLSLPGALAVSASPSLVPRGLAGGWVWRVDWQTSERRVSWLVAVDEASGALSLLATIPNGCEAVVCDRDGRGGWLIDGHLLSRVEFATGARRSITSGDAPPAEHIETDRWLASIRAESEGAWVSLPTVRRGRNGRLLREGRGVRVRGSEISQTGVWRTWSSAPAGPTIELDGSRDGVWSLRSADMPAATLVRRERVAGSGGGEPLRGFAAENGAVVARHTAGSIRVGGVSLTPAARDANGLRGTQSLHTSLAWDVDVGRDRQLGAIPIPGGFAVRGGRRISAWTQE